jgi:hypothetical protein
VAGFKVDFKCILKRTAFVVKRESKGEYARFEL